MSLQDDLQGFCGTEYWYKLNPFVNILATDGVKFFADKGKAYWAVDDMMLTAKDLKQSFLEIKIESKDGKAVITYTDGNEKVLKEDKYSYTDLEQGNYKFYVTNNVIMVTSEY